MTDTRSIPVEELEERELDAAVAEEVLEWHHYGSKHHALANTWKSPDGDIYSEPHRFSSYIGAAWKVHRKMCDQPLSYRSQYTKALQGVVAERHDATGHFIRGGDLAFESVLVLMEPEDICRAALRTVREEGE